jgi:putative ubiquitin-RnfH superfamily antitoxin RatB of RatAB toxin-antitoxin module
MINVRVVEQGITVTAHLAAVPRVGERIRLYDPLTIHSPKGPRVRRVREIIWDVGQGAHPEVWVC